MSEQWENDDVVTTTYGSVQLSLRQAYTAGAITERERILKLLQEQVDGYLIDPYYIEPIIALIKGEDK
jgi:hypothetical protein